MEDFRVKMDGVETIIESPKSMFKMSVYKNRNVELQRNTALIEATVYKEDGAFVKDCSYTFEALDSDNRPLIAINLEIFKNAIDFFFTSILETDLYVKSIPKASSLCGEELKLFQFDIR